MKSASSTTIALLETGGPFYMADLYTFTLGSGIVLHFTDADQSISWGGNTYLSGVVVLTRAKVSMKIGLDTDTMTVTLSAPATTTVPSGLFAGQSYLGAICNGWLDGATISVNRFVAGSSSDFSEAGIVSVFAGRVGNVDIARTVATIEVRSYLELLDMQLPRSLYQAGCSHSLYDSGCSLNRAAFGIGAYIASGVLNSTTYTILGTYPNGKFNQGNLVFQSGSLAGASVNIKLSVGNVLTLSYPNLSLPAIGDYLLIYPGCDKQMTTCSGTFNNLVHFKGQPFVPPPEALL